MPKYYQVSKVLAVRTVDGHREYLLRWKGYGSRAYSWVKEDDCNSTIKNFAGSTLEAREKVINYLMCEIGHKLSTRTATENGYVRQTTVKIPIDQKVFEELLSPFGHGRRRFNVAADDLDKILPVGWSERAFRTSTKCVVSRAQPITVRFANQRKLHYDHSECPRCQWSSGEDEKPALCQPKKTWPFDVSYLFVTFSRERSHQDQKEEETINLSWISSSSDEE